MTVGATKTVFTPAELADLLGGIQLNTPLTGRQVTIATAVVAARVIDKPSLARNLAVRVGTTGTATQTDVMLRKIPLGGTVTDMLNNPVSVINTDADNFSASSSDFVDLDTQKLEPGDVVLVEVTAAPTAGADLDFTANIDQRADPQDEKPLLIGGKTP